MKKGIIIGLVGAPGSGKTTLGRNLGKIMGIEFFEEDRKANAYAYGPKASKAHELEVNIGFLVLREVQHRKAQKIMDTGKDVLMDTVLEMTEIYAKAFSDKTDYKYFLEIYRKFAIEIDKPSVLIYLHGPYDLLSERAIKRKYGKHLEEKYMSAEAIEKADKLIKKYIKKSAVTKIIDINSTECDVRKVECARRIADLIEEVKGD